MNKASPDGVDDIHIHEEEDGDLVEQRIDHPWLVAVGLAYKGEDLPARQHELEHVHHP